jgi:hypothetical protein
VVAASYVTVGYAAIGVLTLLAFMSPVPFPGLAPSQSEFILIGLLILIEFPGVLLPFLFYPNVHDPWPGTFWIGGIMNWFVWVAVLRWLLATRSKRRIQS